MSAKAKFAAITCGLVIGLSGAAHAAWQPAKPIEFIATAGPGGGPDNFARAGRSIITQHKLAEAPLLRTQKCGRRRGESTNHPKAHARAPYQVAVRALHC